MLVRYSGRGVRYGLVDVDVWERRTTAGPSLPAGRGQFPRYRITTVILVRNCNRWGVGDYWGMLLFIEGLKGGWRYPTTPDHNTGSSPGVTDLRTHQHLRKLTSPPVGRPIDVAVHVG